MGAMSPVWNYCVVPPQAGDLRRVGGTSQLALTWNRGCTASPFLKRLKLLASEFLSAVGIGHIKQWVMPFPPLPFTPCLEGGGPQLLPVPPSLTQTGPP